MTLRIRAFLAAASLAAGAMIAGAEAAEIKVIGSTAMREALDELIPMFERTTGHKVIINFQSGADLPVRVEEGVPSDLVLTTPDNIERLAKGGKVTASSRVDFLRSLVGVAVRAGAPRPDITTPDGFKAAMVAAKSVGISKGPSGVHLMSVLQRLGIADQVKAKAVMPALSVRVGRLVANGEAEIGVQQVNELLPIPGIDFIGPLPKELQTEIVYAIVRPINAKETTAADALVKFLTSEAAAPHLRKIGLVPAA